MNVPLDHIMVQIYGPRNQLLGHCRVPAADVPDFAVALQEVKGRNPAYTPASMMRWVVRSGLRAVRRAVEKQAPIPAPSGE